MHALLLTLFLVGFEPGVGIGAAGGPIFMVENTRTPIAVSTPTRKPCPGDLNNDHVVTVGEIIQGINAYLHGCP